ncbi:MAG TPA: hypothetical protein VG347_23455 [Verrucomicrobiae bacterium]|nr:hypothetical protein [Verrucomicrobiae bacterium]
MSALLLVLTLLCLIATGNCAAAPTNTQPPEPFDFAAPALLTGTVYETGSDHKKVLFKFQRTATRSGSTVHAERKFTLPDGTIAATESITYDSGQLVACDMKELQAALWGKIQITGTPKNPSRQKIIISHGTAADTKKAGTSDDLDKDTLIDDTIYPFIMAHWDDLTHGTSVKFRLVAVEWEKTFNFKMSKTGESTYQGMPVMILRMEPTNLLVAHFMNPLIFTVEKNAPHRVVEYVGRTSPRIKSGKTWKYLDADTVFDWK